MLLQLVLLELRLLLLKLLYSLVLLQLLRLLKRGGLQWLLRGERRVGLGRGLLLSPVRWRG